MYKIGSLPFIILLGYLTALYGWTALLWVPLGFIFGILTSSNILLPILLGFPLATSLIFKKQMRAGVFFALMRAPILWFVFLFLLGFFFPSISEWIWNNKPLNIAANLGFALILLSPLSKKVRTDFRNDFHKTWGKYYTNSLNNVDYSLFKITDKKQLKEIGVLMKISTNFYNELITTNRNEFDFSEPHFKYRLLNFCLYSTFKSCESYISNPELILPECFTHLRFVIASDEKAREFLEINISKEDALEIGNNCMETYNNLIDKINFTKVMSSEIVVDKELQSNLKKIISFIETDNVNKTYGENEIRIKNLNFILKSSFGIVREAFLELMR
ncbi:MAG: hypothetical protein M3Z26_15170 [Bacteroidota bacterium]|nr:hypothetical protein [Bacteroidota bacterium]